MSGVIFCDTETTGLYPALGHRPWEIAFIEEDGTEKVWQVDVDLSVADPTGLRICRFYERYDLGQKPEVVAAEVAVLTAGKHLVGAVPSFDALMLEALLRDHGYVPAWHYHLIDVEALAVGFLWAQETVVRVPWDSDALTKLLGIEPPDEDVRHTALGDARWARSIWQRVTGEASNINLTTEEK